MGKYGRTQIRKGGGVMSLLDFPERWVKEVKKFIAESKSIQVKYVMLNDVKPPTKAHDDDAGFDIYSADRYYISSQQTAVVKTGLAFEIPKGWHMQIHTRSSYGAQGLRCHLGIVDAGYRGEVKVIIQNHTFQDMIINKGDKFCQVLFVPTPRVGLIKVDKLEDSDRGEAGFGSSGK